VQVEITNSFGCVTRETIDILLNCEASINAPDAIRPNSPIEENTVWRVYPFLVSPDGFQLFIFNRWGEMIVASQDLQFEWNGGYNNDPGRPVPGGTYAYRIIFNSINNDGSGPQEERGAITVIR
jgi:gliding motility-associated-like protein